MVSHLLCCSSLVVRMEDESGSVFSLEHGRSSPWAHAQSRYRACAVRKVPDESCACVYAVRARIIHAKCLDLGFRDSENSQTKGIPDSYHVPLTGDGEYLAVRAGKWVGGSTKRRQRLQG